MRCNLLLDGVSGYLLGEALISCFFKWLSTEETDNFEV